MIVQHKFQSVADLMGKRPTPAEAHLITPAWSPRSVLRNEGRTERR